MRVPAPYVFISHSSKNNVFTQQLTDDLQAAGFHVWVDLEALRDGERWVAEIQAAVEGCAAVVVVISRAARESEWVEREVLLALDLNRPLFIARLEAVPLPLPLITRQFTDFTGEYAPALAKLSAALRPAMAGNATASAATGSAAASEPIIRTSAGPDESNFFAYLEQMSPGKLLALLAQDLYTWAQKHADEVVFGGRHTPAFHARVRTPDGHSLTVFSLLAYMRHPALQIPLDYLSKYPPYTDPAQRLAVLERLNALLPPDERFPPQRPRPTLTLATALDTAEELEAVQVLLLEMMAALRRG
ncbi:MAG: toll/interleukin-1 receptor domain-containing protein [Anaerolineae bacterium]|jgi:hypothetical protein|nr:toll/interleukin-1 receptor domain-containing protein [Anaerolineae bacterium]